MSPRGRHNGRCLIVHFDDVADHRTGLRIRTVAIAAAALHIFIVCVRRIAYFTDIDVGHFAGIVREMQFDFFEGAVLRFGQKEVNGKESVREFDKFELIERKTFLAIFFFLFWRLAYVPNDSNEPIEHRYTWNRQS